MTTHEHGYYLDEAPQHRFDPKLAAGLALLFWQRDGYVVDMGCGNGAYVEYLNNNGVNCIGLEGNPALAKRDVVVTADLAEPLPCYINGDWCFSIEVGEHIPRQYEAMFLANLCQMGRKGIVLSWAYPGQGGRDHVNERTPGDISTALRQRGYVANWPLSNRLRSMASFEYLTKTLAVFQRERV